MNWVFVDKDRCELRWMWLPTFLAQNTALLKELELELNKRFKGMQATERNLAAMDVFIMTWLQSKIPYIPGLQRYLEGLKYVEEC